MNKIFTVILSHQREIKLAGVLVATAAGSSALTYVVTKKHLDAVYSARSSEEIQEAKEFYQRQTKTGDFADPIALAEQYADKEPSEDELRRDSMVKETVEILKTQEYVAYDKVDQSEQEAVEVRSSIASDNIFSTYGRDEDLVFEDDYDLDDELDKQRAGKPYLIEEEKFFENEDERSQSSLIWYEEDQVLTDDSDRVIRNVDGVIGGTENLRFGSGTKSRNTVYISNDKFHADYEVVRNEGSYTEQVLGLKSSLSHSDRPRVRKFRNVED